MERYNPEAKCPKCGFDDINTTFVLKYKSWPYCGCDVSMSEKEHIDRHCRRCSFQWPELPIDANKKMEK